VDSKLPDAQTGHEKTLTAMLPALAGANLIYGMGMLEMGQVLSFSQMVMDNEFAAMIKRSIRGIEVSDELMAVEIIKQVGIGGNFLGQKHTMEHLADEQVQADMIARWLGKERCQRSPPIFRGKSQGDLGNPSTQTIRRWPG
jgi:trimethylamine--corrinoid protein Co-methyltransferase